MNSRLFDAMGGNPDNHFAANQAARRLQRQVFLPQMHAVGSGQHRDVRAIVDDQHRAALAAHRRYFARRGEQAAARRVLQPKLHHPRAGVEQRPRERGRLVTARRIGHRIEMRGELHRGGRARG